MLVDKPSAFLGCNQNQQRDWLVEKANPMDHKLYTQYMHAYLKDALQNGCHTPTEIARYLDELPWPGRFARNKEERIRALRAVRQAFTEHRHWPLDIILSHLGIDAEKIK
jgi:hypothetical protein